jgi:tripartite ATP-independent transporter DctM subunit
VKKAATFENTLACIAILAMALLPIIEIITRQLSRFGIPGSIMWTRLLVLWVAFLGAVIAARRGELLSLATRDLITGRSKRLVDILTSGVSFSVCAVLFWVSLQFVRLEREGGSLFALDVPVWVVQLIMPIGFVLIAVRILARVPGGWKVKLASALFLLVPLLLTWPFDLRDSGLLIPLLFGVILATALGVPIFILLAVTAAVLLWDSYEPVMAIPMEAYNLSVKGHLPAIPLFTLAGFILAEGGTPKRLVALFRALFGWIPGGVAVVAILVCAFFTSFTGGSGVTILAMGGLLFPMLIHEKYSDRFTTGLLTSAGSLGLLFIPSLAVILYSVLAEIEIRKLFVSGFVPAIMELALVAVYVFLFSRRTAVTRVRFKPRPVFRAMHGAIWELVVPALVLGSFLGGFATLVETAAITVLYAFLLEFAIRRNLNLASDLLRVVGNAATLVGGVLLILGVAMGLTNFLIIAEIPDQTVEWVQSFVESPLFFLLLLNLFLLAVGCLMDIYSAITVVVPLIVPVALAFGIDPFHLGIIFLINLELGYLTPPVGMNLFLAAYRFERPLGEVYKAALPCLGIRCVAVLLVTYVPAITTYLPKALGLEE